MSLFRKKTEEPEDIHYEGSAVLRMLSYMRPHVGTMAFCLVLVLAITALELYKPVLIGNAIDRYITGGYAPGEAVEERTHRRGSVRGRAGGPVCLQPGPVFAAAEDGAGDHL